MTLGLLFGTFDGVHAGHVAFLQQARKHVDTLIASVPSNELVEQLKGHKPKHSLSERTGQLASLKLIDKIVESDPELGSFSVIEQLKPDVIILGYDQMDLQVAIEKWLTEHHETIPIIVLAAHQPEVYKSSILNSV